MATSYTWVSNDPLWASMDPLWIDYVTDQQPAPIPPSGGLDSIYYAEPGRLRRRRKVEHDDEELIVIGAL